MRALVIDDESVARNRLRRMLGRIDGVVCVGEAADGEEALVKVKELSPDVVFLDIRMPELDGLEVARMVSGEVHVVFTTAYDEYAVQAFEASAIDYLLKPVQSDRLATAIEKVRHRMDGPRSEDLQRLLHRIARQEGPPRISARQGDTIQFFDPREIGRFFAQDRYTVFRHAGQEYLLDDSITALEERLADWGFVRVHRSELILLGKVRALRREDDLHYVELADGQRAAVSRRHLKHLKQRLGIPVG